MNTTELKVGWYEDKKEGVSLLRVMNGMVGEVPHNLMEKDTMIEDEFDINKELFDSLPLKDDVLKDIEILKDVLQDDLVQSSPKIYV